MKIEQQPEFQPITITLETKQEAESLWHALRDEVINDYDNQDIIIKLCNWFSQHAQL